MLRSKIHLSFMITMIALMSEIVFPQKVAGLTWNTPPTVFVSSPNGSFFDLASDPTGNAFSAYVDNLTNTLSVSRFSNALQVYTPPVVISAGNEILGISIATDASGTALLTWFDITTNQVLTSYFDMSTWRIPLPIPLDVIPSASGAYPDVAMNGLGNGLVGWRRDGLTSPGDIGVSFFNGATQSWGPIQILTPPGTGGQEPKVAYSRNGTAVAIWNDGVNNLVASNFNTIFWSPVPPTIGTNVNNYDVKIDSAGNALVVWTDTGGNVFSSFYDGVLWGVPQALSTSPISGFASFAMASTKGTAIAVWTDASNIGVYSEFINGIWTTPTPFAENVNNISIAVDSVGNALITWDDLNVGQTFSIYKPFGGPLRTPDLVTPTSSELFPRISALSDNGRGFVDGIIEPGEGSGISGSFTLLPSQMVITGRMCNNRFATQTDHVHIISIVPVSDPAVIAYILRRNGVVIATIPASGPFTFFDNKRCRKEIDVYSVTPVSITGIEGPAAFLSL